MRHARAARQHLVETQHGGDRQRRRRLCIGEERSPAGPSMVSFSLAAAGRECSTDGQISTRRPCQVPELASALVRRVGGGRSAVCEDLRASKRRECALARAGRTRRRENVVCAALLS